MRSALAAARFIICVALLMLFIQVSALGPAFAFKTAHFSLDAPQGWNEKVNFLGMDVYYVGSFTTEVAPVFMVMTQPKELKPEELATFLKQDLKRTFEKRKTSYRIKSEGKFKPLSADSYSVELEYMSEQGAMRDLAVLVRGKGRYHLLMFTARASEYDFFYKDVAKSLASFRLNAGS